MTAAISLRRRDEQKPNLAGQMLFYPEARIPFDTPAASENNTGYYLECNGIFSFADHYLPRGTPPSHPYISPGMQSVDYLKNQPPAAVFTCGFDPLRDVGVEYASKLAEAGVEVKWFHHPESTHGFLQMTAWSEDAERWVKGGRDGVEEDGGESLVAERDCMAKVRAGADRILQIFVFVYMELAMENVYKPSGTNEIMYHFANTMPHMKEGWI